MPTLHLKQMQQQGTHEGTHEMASTNCQINLMSTWHENCVIPNAAEMPKVETTKSRLYVSMVTSSLQNNLL